MKWNNKNILHKIIAVNNEYASGIFFNYKRAFYWKKKQGRASSVVNRLMTKVRIVLLNEQFCWLTTRRVIDKFCEITNEFNRCPIHLYFHSLPVLSKFDLSIFMTFRYLLHMSSHFFSNLLRWTHHNITSWFARKLNFSFAQLFPSSNPALRCCPRRSMTFFIILTKILHPRFILFRWFAYFIWDFLEYSRTNMIRRLQKSLSRKFESCQVSKFSQCWKKQLTSFWVLWAKEKWKCWYIAIFFILF